MTKEEAKTILQCRGNMYSEEEFNEALEIAYSALDSFLPSNLDKAAEKYAEPYHDKMAVVEGFKACAEWMAEWGIKLHGRILPGPRCNLYIESDCFDRGYKGLNYSFSDSNDVDMFVQIRKK